MMNFATRFISMTYMMALTAKPTNHAYDISQKSSLVQLPQKPVSPVRGIRHWEVSCQHGPNRTQIISAQVMVDTALAV